MRVLEQEQEADQRGAEGARPSRVDGDWQRVRHLREDDAGERKQDERDACETRERRAKRSQTSSSSASSARSMMKRKRADASFPISSFITRSVTI